MQKNLQAAVEAELISFLVESVKTAIYDGDLDLEKVPEVSVEVPREKGHGDYATNLAMVLAGQAGMNPRQIAEIIVENFESEIVEEISIAGPGFINFKLKNAWLWNNLKLITKRAEDYGKIDAGKGKRVQVEFVSANPTGPLHVGHSRGAVVGDVTASIMEAAGFDVEREYYINDAGNQMDILGQSTLLRYRELLGEDIKMPEDIYAGEYVKEIAQDLYQEYGSDLMEKEEAERLEICREYAYQEMLKNIEADLEKFGIEFDSWFSERTLHPDHLPIWQQIWPIT